VFVPGNPFQPSLKFVDRSRAYPRGEFLKCAPFWIGSKPYTQILHEVVKICQGQKL
jgi:hypothetical protein